MQNIYLVLHTWQANLLPQLPNNFTINTNYNNFEIGNYDLIIDATNQWETNITNEKTWLINEPVKCNTQLPLNAVRFNAWPSFFENNSWEISGKLDIALIKIIELHLLKKLIQAPDKVGLISGRIIAAIINEAYEILEKGISTKEDIDLAMKLGTNYPFGPFEWAEKIGLQNIKALLLAKQLENTAYIPNSLIINNN